MCSKIAKLAAVKVKCKCEGWGWHWTSCWEYVSPSCGSKAVFKQVWLRERCECGVAWCEEKDGKKRPKKPSAWRKFYVCKRWDGAVWLDRLRNPPVCNQDVELYPVGKADDNLAGGPEGG